MKLTVGPPDDPFEREADRAAASVTAGGQTRRHSSMPPATAGRPSAAVGGGGPTPLSGRITSPGGGRPLPDSLRGEMEASFGADFSRVRVHDTARDRDDAERLGAKAFTHKQDIWVGKNGSANDRMLMAHELTHVLQQGAAVRRLPSDYPPAAASDVPDIQGAWYNFDIPFTDYQFDPSISGIKTAAGLAKDTAVDTAGWAKDKVVAGFEWVFDKIKGLVTAGIDWLSSRFDDIKEFASSAFDTIRNGLAALIDQITSPAELLTKAFQAMDAGSIAKAWGLLKSGAALVWKGMKATVDGVLSIGTGLWETASGYVSTLVNTVEAIIDSWPFRQLPLFLQAKARAIFEEFRALWARVRDFITDLLTRLRAHARQILESIEAFVTRIVDYSIDIVIDTVKQLAEMWEFVRAVAADPIGFIKPHTDKLAGTLNAEAPPKAVALGNEKLQENQRRESVSGDEVLVQRQADTTKKTRSTAGLEEISDGFTRAISAAWAGLDIGQMLLDTIVNMFWPPATIRAIGHEFSELWNTDWTNAANSLFAPRAPWDDFWGFLHDIWSNILVLLDFPLALWRRLNSVVMLFMGYVTILLVIIGAIVGGVLAGPPGIVAGAGVGLEIAASIGVVLLTSYLYAESISFIKSFVDLTSARQTDEEKERDYVQMAGSLIGMAVAILIVVILWFISSLVGALVRLIKGKPPAPPAVNPAESVKAAEPVKPGEPVKPVEPVKPAEPAKPAEEIKPGEPPEAAKPAEKVSEVAGKPNTVRVGDASALEATKPSRIQGPLNKAFWHWELFVTLPNGEIAVFCEINIRFRGSPDLNLHPKTAIVKGTGRTVNLEAQGFKWTTESLKLMIESYRAKFGHAPKNLGGWLAKSNLRNFQNEFARIRAAKPGLSTQQVAQEAVKAISFGTQRIPLGYEHFYVSILKVGKVLLDDGSTQTVPTLVRVEAGKVPINPSTIPPFAVPEIGEGEGEEE